MVLQAISRPGLLRLAKGNNTGIKPSQVGHDSESPGPCELRESPKHESLQGLVSISQFLVLVIVCVSVLPLPCSVLCLAIASQLSLTMTFVQAGNVCYIVWDHVYRLCCGIEMLTSKIKIKGTSFLRAQAQAT